MSARQVYLDGRIRLPGKPHGMFCSSASPSAPSKEPRALPERSIISWRTVTTAGGIAWLLVGGLVLLVWTANNRLSLARAALPLPGSEPVESIAAVSVARPSAPIANPGEPVAAPAGAQAALAQPVSFKKAPISPPLPVEEKERAIREPELPASELSPGEEGAPVRTFGTQVAFTSSPTEAARKALKERKLLFVLHLSGHFEDKQFT